MSKDQLEHYVELTVKQFADNSAGIRWCPYPDCGYAICIKDEAEQAAGATGVAGGGGGRGGAGTVGGKVVENGGSSSNAGKERTNGRRGGGEVAGAMAQDLPFQPGWNVECGRGHGFCWYVCMYMYPQAPRSFKCIYNKSWE